jgi:hypothetical protein
MFIRRLGRDELVIDRVESLQSLVNNVSPCFLDQKQARAQGVSVVGGYNLTEFISFLAHNQMVRSWRHIQLMAGAILENNRSPRTQSLSVPTPIWSRPQTIGASSAAPFFT